MFQVKVYRNFGNHLKLEFRTYRTSIDASLNNTIESIKIGAKTGLKLLEYFGKQAPKKYLYLWSDRNPFLDSTYAYLSQPNQEELNPKEVTKYIILPDGSLSNGKKEISKNNWAEFSVNTKKCLVAPHILAGKILCLQETEHIHTYWNNTIILEDFLKQYKPIGTPRSERAWQHRESKKIYGTPEVLIPLDAIQTETCKFLNT